MSGRLSVSVTVSVPNGGAWMGQGKDLTEALAVLHTYLLDLTPEDRAPAEVALQGPPVTAEITSGARWWNPFTWGRITVRWTI